MEDEILISLVHSDKRNSRELLCNPPQVGGVLIQCRSNAGLMLAQRRRQWDNIKPALNQPLRLMCAGRRDLLRVSVFSSTTYLLYIIYNNILRFY